MINTYLATSKEFQPITITKTVQGVVTNVLTGVQYVVVPKGTDLQEGDPETPVLLDGEIGFFTDTFAPGYWEVGARIASTPEEPFIPCGHFRIK